MKPRAQRPRRAGFASIRRLGVFGGSFDPVHDGHLYVAQAAQRAFDLDHVVFVPARRPPHKLDRSLSAARHRLRMLELALEGRADWSICELELSRAGPSYTIDTLRALPRALDLARSARLYLILGGDNLAGFAHWKDAREILRRAAPIVIQRGANETLALEQAQEHLGAAAAAKLRRGLLALEPLPISATRLRQALGAGRAPRGLPRAVRRYAQEQQLYRPEKARRARAKKSPARPARRAGRAAAR